MYVIRLADGDGQFLCAPHHSVLEGMQRLARKGIPVGCRGGGCGVCRIRVLSGRYHWQRMSREHISEADEGAGIGLACRLYADSDLEIAVLGLQRSDQGIQQDNKRKST
ncbi:2Fe-2S iron-sulfur cluster-binding protein [Pseudomonas japonica]|uniref:2Fe-2S iron-sulfur cluster-binding protein n=1 Tax=Pseudomonas japonica TaxID=256466 RepID=UPI00381F3C93